MRFGAVVPWAAALLIMVAGCSQNTRNQDIILITIDTLRADHMSCYGYPRTTTPFIDRLARSGTVFRHAYATSSWTIPSMASIFTGLYPRSHGVVHGQVNGRKRLVVKQQLLTDDRVTLAELFQANGYTTFGISTNGHIAAETGFHQGFDHFAEFWFSRADSVNHVIKEWIHDLRDTDRFFLWVHYFDPHDPYFDKHPWMSEYNPDPLSYAGWKGQKMARLRSLEERLRDDPGAVNALKDLYDSEINYTDLYIRKLIEDLPVNDHTMIVITADHGEGFMDHQLIGHGNSMYEELIHIPLIIVPPGRQPAVHTVDSPACLNDILPTLCDAAGIDIPDDTQGQSLLPWVTGEEPFRERTLFAELDRPQGDQYYSAVMRGGWKVILGGRPAETRELYQVSQDSHETQDQSQSHPDRAAELEAALIQWQQDTPLYIAPSIDKELTDQERLELQQLGYLY